MTRSWHSRLRAAALAAYGTVLATCVAVCLAAVFGVPSLAFADEAVAQGGGEKRTAVSTVGVDAVNATAGSNTLAAAGATSSLPERFDAREQGWVTPLVRNQDPWGSCWAISALEAIETNLLRQGIALPDSFSPRHLMWAAGTPVEDARAAVQGNSGVQLNQISSQLGEGQHAIDELVETLGANAPFEVSGNFYVVYQTIASGRGPLYERTAPYANDEHIAAGSSYSTGGTWTLPESLRFESVAQLRHVHALPTPARFETTTSTDGFYLDIDALTAVKQAIVEYGSVAIAYDQSEDAYNPEQYTWFSDTSRGNGHGVQIVGWDDTIDRNLFTTGTYGLPEGDGAWIVRNSWGAEGQAFPNEGEWGDGGYFYLSYYDRSAQMFTAYEAMLSSDARATTIINQYDLLGQMSQASARIYSTTDTIRSANVFTAEQDQILRAVSADTYEPNTTVTVQVYLLDDDAARPSKGTTDPTKGKLLEETSTTFAYGGYHRIQLKTGHRITKGQRFAIVQTIVEPDGTHIASMEAGNSRTAVEQWGYAHYDTVIINEGESYLFASLYDDEPVAWMDAIVVAHFLTEHSALATPYGNVCIKAFSDALSTPASDTPQEDPAQQPSQTKPAASTTSAKSSNARPTLFAGQTSAKPTTARSTAATGDTWNIGGRVQSPLALAGLFAPLAIVGFVGALVAFAVRARTHIRIL